MEEIFLVEKTFGDYEDKYVEVDKAFKDKKSAEDYIELQNKKYEGIYEIAKDWSNCWDNKIEEIELGLDEGNQIVDTSDKFIDFIKFYFPEDYSKYGEVKIRFAYELYERGQLYDLPFFSLSTTMLVDE